MKKILFVTMMIMCAGLTACESADTADVNIQGRKGYEFCVDAENRLGDMGENFYTELVEKEKEATEAESVAENAIENFEEEPIEWNGERAEVTTERLYRISQSNAFVIDFEPAGSEWINGLAITNPPQYQKIIIRAKENEIELSGDYIEPTEAFLLQTAEGYFLLLETDEGWDTDEQLWLFQMKDGHVVQCGEPMQAKLDDDEAWRWRADHIKCSEIVNITDRMTEREYASSAIDFIYQRKYYKIANGQLTAVEELAETELIETDLHTYKATMYRNAETERIIRWEVEIYNGDELFQTIYYDHDENVGCIPDLYKLIWEEDVNFDGEKDILVWQGHYGTHGDLAYRCYLANGYGGLYEFRPEFQEIPNPKVDKEQKLIYGICRGSASVYYDYFYRYDGNTFVLAQRNIYAWDDASEKHLLVCSLDADVVVYTETDYALVGTYEGTSGREYSISIYTSMDGVGECRDIGNIADITSADEYAERDLELLYKISKGQYCVFDYDTLTAYYLYAQVQNGVWTIEIKDRDGNVLDTLTQTEHYEA